MNQSLVINHHDTHGNDEVDDTTQSPLSDLDQSEVTILPTNERNMSPSDVSSSNQFIASNASIHANTSDDLVTLTTNISRNATLISSEEENLSNPTIGNIQKNSSNSLMQVNSLTIPETTEKTSTTNKSPQSTIIHLPATLYTLPKVTTEAPADNKSNKGEQVKVGSLTNSGKVVEKKGISSVSNSNVSNNNATVTAPIIPKNKKTS